MENVRTLASHETGTVLKLVLSALMRMGYQVAFGVLQVGHFGVQQSRQRLIIMAPAPGERLPASPPPMYVTAAGQQPKITVNHCTVNWSCSNAASGEGPMREGAPRRCITVWDTFADLPEIQLGHEEEEMLYSEAPHGHLS
jgi:DNA (cytosine-5)-methyltransferase 1